MLNRSTVEVKMLFGFFASVARVVSIWLADAVVLPVTLKSMVGAVRWDAASYSPGPGPSFVFIHPFSKRPVLVPNAPSLTPCDSARVRSSLILFRLLQMEELFGLLISMYWPGPGPKTFYFLLTARSSLLPKGMFTVSSMRSFDFMSSPFFLPRV